MAWFYSEFCLCLLLFSFPISLSDPALPENQTEAVKGLISRLLGEDYVEKFDLQIISATSQGRDVFEIDSSGNADQGETAKCVFSTFVLGMFQGHMIDAHLSCAQDEFSLAKVQ